MLIALLACAEPSLLAPVEDALGDGVVAEAADGVRLAVAVDGLLAELCGVRDADGYVFVGAPAGTLGATTVSETADATTGSLAWDFGEIGLGDLRGTLRVTTDTARRGYAIQWAGEGQAMSGTLEERCDVDAGEASLGGTLTHLVGSDRRTITFVGDAPALGLAWRLPPRDVPVAGQVRWAREAEVLLLDDAAAIADDVWPGTANGADWTARVQLSVTAD